MLGSEEADALLLEQSKALVLLIFKVSCALPNSMCNFTRSPILEISTYVCKANKSNLLLFPKYYWLGCGTFLVLLSCSFVAPVLPAGSFCPPRFR